MDRCTCTSEIMPYFNQILTNNSLGDDQRKAYEFAVFSKEDGAYAGIADIVLEIKNAAGGIAQIGYFLHKNGQWEDELRYAILGGKNTMERNIIPGFYVDALICPVYAGNHKGFFENH